MSDTLCPRPVWLAWAVDPDTYHPGDWRAGPVSGISPTPCKRWACGHCGKGKRAEALRLIRHGAAVGLEYDPRQPLRFVTLTRPRDKPNDLSDRADASDASADVRELIRAWRRDGRVLEYVRVLERTKRGRIHVHLLTWGHYIAKCTDKGRRSRGLPTGRDSGSPCYCSEGRPCIQRLAWDHGWGWVDVRAVRSPERAAAYIAKYIAKASADDWPRHARRLSYSRQFSGGVTLGLIHERWVDEVRRRLAGDTPDHPERSIVWLGIAPTPTFGDPSRAPPLPDPDYRRRRWVDFTTGEILPDPY